MPHATPSRSQIRLCRIFSCTAILALASAPAFAANFSVAAGTTDNTAKTLGSGSGQTGSVAATGTLQVGGSTVAVTISGNNATLTNNGTIKQTGDGRAIRDNTGVTGLVVNNGSATNSNALMQTADADVIQMNKTPASVTLNNYGSMLSLNASAGGSQAVDFTAILSGANTVNNFSTGLMKAFEADAVRTGVNGIVNNSGTILAVTTTGSSSDGVDVQNNTGAQITNNNGGLIEGGRHGITGGAASSGVIFTTTVTNNAGGVIKGNNGSGINLDGFNANQSATIINNGAISGNGVTGDGDGIDVDGTVNITNSGIIRSINAFNLPAAGLAYSEGITVGGGTITNSGTIEGLVASGNTNAVGRGITLAGNDITSGINAGKREAIYASTVITNQSGGLIRGDSDSGIAVDGLANTSGFTVTINNQAGATIHGGGTANAAIRTGADNDTITNDGTINGSSSGKAVDMGGGTNILNYNGGTITGSINGGTGSNNTLNLGAGVSHAYATQNFKNISVASGSSSLVGIVSGLNLTKGGIGTLELTNANTYTGATTVAAGTLKVNNTSGSGTGTSSVLVQSGATLGGSGIISGTVTVDGIIAPGNSIGTLSVGNNVTWNGTAGNKWNFELGAGNTSDRLNITGDFLKGSGSNFYFDFLNSAATGIYVLVDWSNASNFQASDFSYVNLGGGLTGTFAFNGSQLEFTAIPEPATTTMLLGTGALAFTVYLRRRRTVVASPAVRVSL